MLCCQTTLATLSCEAPPLIPDRVLLLTRQLLTVPLMIIKGDTGLSISVPPARPRRRASREPATRARPSTAFRPLNERVGVHNKTRRARD